MTKYVIVRFAEAEAEQTMADVKQLAFARTDDRFTNAVRLRSARQIRKALDSERDTIPERHP